MDILTVSLLSITLLHATPAPFTPVRMPPPTVYGTSGLWTIYEVSGFFCSADAAGVEDERVSLFPGKGPTSGSFFISVSRSSWSFGGDATVHVTLLIGEDETEQYATSSGGHDLTVKLPLTTKLSHALRNSSWIGMKVDQRFYRFAMDAQTFDLLMSCDSQQGGAKPYF